ncbi:MAG: DNA topoisomerase [Heterodermia speciosa]|uniref:DNA topoisomerase n=1 Tax=Heterodermia speciosa TaxID=116794 RepID=A0A8H3IAE4_9LECA|nr:MAG: DNA topoisomerase [Heterodermia speciosa]
MAPNRILCVAEKPSIAKAVAQHLSGGHVNARNVPGNQYIKNYEFDFSFGQPWGSCSVTMTSVLGHLTEVEFPQNYRRWNSCAPAQLFEAPIETTVAKDKKPIADNITKQARYAKALFIWTDCDREGEHIGSEVRQAALEGNSRLQVKRARFSNTERAHIVRAAQNPVDLDDRQVTAVAARIEIDLRLGAAFTRYQTLTLQGMGGDLAEKLISYGQNLPLGLLWFYSELFPGSCQFPTLGFVVDRYFRVKNFIPEKFWSIKVDQMRDDVKVQFSWRRNRLFDRGSVIVIFERCLAARTARVSKMQKKPTSKWRPLPLTTVELQKLGSMYLRMDSQKVMKVAEDLYNKGWISYPRTETDQFDKGIDLRALVQKQAQDRDWGPHAQGLLNGNFKQPRTGRNNDQAHPPIHPVNYVSPGTLGQDDRKVYEFVVRRFLACCSEDAKGEMTTIEIEYGDETFFTNGLIVLQRNYLEVYPYERWESSQQLPNFVLHEVFEPTEANVTEGETTPPGYMTEPELIGLMDANGIGTDATMAEHISKIKDREYVQTQPVGGGGRGRVPGNSVQQFIPTTLGVALIEGYDNIGLDTSLGKPFLRKEMEAGMREVCAGTKSRNDFLHETLDRYRDAFVRIQQQVAMLRAVRDPYHVIIFFV